MALRRLRWLGVVLLAFELAFLTKPIERYVLSPKISLLPKGCMVAAREWQAAVKAEQGLRHYKIWAHLLTVSYGWFAREGHAYCIYMLDDGNLAAYDINFGTVELGTKDTSAQTVLKRLKRRYPEIRSGRYAD